MKNPVRISVTGAAGNIGYQLAFRIAAGEMLGQDQPVILQLIEITPALEALKGVEMELRDCAFPLLRDVIITDKLDEGFNSTDYALLVGSKPRGPGMERNDLLASNGEIFKPQGKALNDYANKDVKVLVVGNPANTNALIARSYAPDLNPNNFTAMTRLDHNRAAWQLAEKLDAHANDIKNIIIWGNHSATQHPDISNCTLNGEKIANKVNDTWYKDTFIPDVQQRGATVIKQKGSSSAASAASAAMDHMRSWALGTKDNEWVSMAVPSDGSYGIKPGIIFSYPCICKDGNYEIVQNLELSEFDKERLLITEQELQEERTAVENLL